MPLRASEIEAEEMSQELDSLMMAIRDLKDCTDVILVCVRPYKETDTSEVELAAVLTNPEFMIDMMEAALDLTQDYMIGLGLFEDDPTGEVVN